MPSAEQGATVRRNAEQLLRDRLRNPRKPSGDEVRRLVYDLEVNRSELESENRQLAKTRSRIEEARDRYADLYEFAPLGYALLSEDGRLQELNQTLADLLQRERDILVDSPFTDLVAARDRESLTEHLAACCEGSQTDRCIEVRLRIDADRHVPVQLHTVRANGADGTGSHGFRMAVTDITELMREREEKQRMERRLQHMQKLQSLVTMAGGIAHDFNNILTVIQGYADMAVTDSPEGSPVKHYCQEVLSACRRATSLSSQMLAFAGQWERSVKRMKLNDIVSGMRSIIESVVEKKAPIEYLLSEEAPVVDVDVIRMQQAVLNLVTNAVEALVSQPTGRIRIATTATDLDVEAAEQVAWGDRLQPGRYALLEVSDNGVGMDAATRARMFDPFFSTKFVGRGLGLGAVLGIVRAHDGGIDVRTSPGNGTVVRIYLPLAPARIAGSGGLDGEKDQDWRVSNVVLIADDEKRILDIVKRSLTRRGFTVLTARDGKDAVRVFEENRDAIDAVLLDMTMPRMNGKEAFKQIRSLDEHVPVFFTSGYAQSEAMGDAGVEGVAAFIQKPFSADEISRRLRDVLKERDSSQTT